MKAVFYALATLLLAHAALAHNFDLKKKGSANYLASQAGEGWLIKDYAVQAGICEVTLNDDEIPKYCAKGVKSEEYAWTQDNSKIVIQQKPFRVVVSRPKPDCVHNSASLNVGVFCVKK